MRVLQVIAPPKRLKTGGAANVVANLSASLAARGHKVIVASTAGRPFTLRLAELGLDVRAVALTGKLNPFAALALANLARAESIQILHAHLSTAAVAASLAGRIARLPVAVTVHGMTHAFYCRLANRVIAVSQAVCQHMVQRGIAPDRVVVVRNGVDIERFSSLPTRECARQLLGLPADARVVGTVGRLSEAKGHRYLLEAGAGLKSRFPQLRVLVVGEGEALAALVRRTRSLQLEGRVVLTGYRQDIDVVLAALDIYVQPSLEEGLGLAVMEAMAAGLPVVVTRVGGLPELVENGRTGLLVAPGDARALSDAIGLLLSDDELRARLGEAARTHVRAHHGWGKVAEQVERVYYSLLRRHGTSLAVSPPPPDA